MNTKGNSSFKIKIDALIGEALNKQIFSACSLGFFKINKGKTHREIFYYGRTGVGLKNRIVCNNTIFDLASLTKPLVTSMTLLYLLNGGKINFDDNLKKYICYIERDKYPIKIHHLISHTSGLPAHKSYFNELIKIPFDGRKNQLEKQIISEKLCFYPGEKSLYSDLGYILLGFIIEKITGEAIDVFWQKNILKPLKLQREIFFSNKIINKQNCCAETGICPWSKKVLQGFVNDDNCRALGGVAGHAGLFATTSGLLSFLEKILCEINEITNIFQWNQETIKTFYKTKSESSWVNGFDTPSSCNSSSGKYFSDLTFGHLGFTGTSFWMDMKLGCGVVLLTNRVLCSADLNPIRKFRPLLHNMVMEHILTTKIPEN